MKHYEGFLEVKVEDVNQYIGERISFIASSLVGRTLSISSPIEIILDPSKYERLGDLSERGRFYIFQELYDRKCIAYLITSQGYPLMYLDKWNDWHLVGATKSKLAKKHLSYLNLDRIHNTKFENTFKILSSKQTENEALKMSAESSVALVIMEYEEDGK